MKINSVIKLGKKDYPLRWSFCFKEQSCPECCKANEIYALKTEQHLEKASCLNYDFFQSELNW